jgi:radical SAM superfamily enzyme YgiQ (UPF0313 family)
MGIALYSPISLSSGSYTKTSPPVALIGIAHEVSKLGAETLIVDEDNLTRDNAVDVLRGVNPDIVGVSTYFDPKCATRVSTVVEAFRGKASIIVGGYDASSDTDRVISELNPDIVVIGEGEIPMSEMTRVDFNLTRLDPEKVSVELRGDTWVVKAKERYDLDNLPLPTDLPSIAPNRTSWHEAVINIARGCIGQCTFCAGADITPVYMSPERVVEHIFAWHSLGNRGIDLMAPDLTSLPTEASRIIREINQHPEIQGLDYFISVRQDSMVRALDLTYRSGEPALKEWQTFIERNRVLIEAGFETSIERKLARGHFNKARDAEAHYRNLVRLLETGTEVAVDLISFDPDTSLKEIANDYWILFQLAKKYMNMKIYPEAIFRELKLYPGTKAAEIFGRRRICGLIGFFSRNFNDAGTMPSQVVIDRIIEAAYEQPELLKNFLRYLNP